MRNINLSEGYPSIFTYDTALKDAGGFKIRVNMGKELLSFTQDFIHIDFSRVYAHVTY